MWRAPVHHVVDDMAGSVQAALPELPARPAAHAHLRDGGGQVAGELVAERLHEVLVHLQRRAVGQRQRVVRPQADALGVAVPVLVRQLGPGQTLLATS